MNGVRPWADESWQIAGDEQHGNNSDDKACDILAQVDRHTGQTNANNHPNGRADDAPVGVFQDGLLGGFCS